MALTQKQYEELWAEFGDVPMNPETEEIEAQFLHFLPGTYREDIWHWFDEGYDGGVFELMYKSDYPCNWRGEPDDMSNPLYYDEQLYDGDYDDDYRNI